MPVTLAFVSARSSGHTTENPRESRTIVTFAPSGISVQTLIDLTAAVS
jgi:hypothetical protein